MKYDKIQLTYEFNDLEPYIDALTVETHYSKHLQTYVNNLNNLLVGYEIFTEGKTLEDILSDLNEIPDKIRNGVINQGGGVLNHNLYFSLLSPLAKKEPEGDLLKDINNTFGDLETLKKLISSISINQFGSGYGWLVLNKEANLEVISTLNQDTPLSLGFKPLLTIDVWEHSYYLKYKNLRAEYVKNIWNIIDWNIVEKLYKEYKC